MDADADAVPLEKVGMDHPLVAWVCDKISLNDAGASEKEVIAAVGDEENNRALASFVSDGGLLIAAVGSFGGPARLVRITQEAADALLQAVQVRGGGRVRRPYQRAGVAERALHAKFRAVIVDLCFL